MSTRLTPAEEHRLAFKAAVAALAALRASRTDAEPAHTSGPDRWAHPVRRTRGTPPRSAGSSWARRI